MIDIKITPRGLTFAVYVLPRSAKTAIVGNHQDALKLKLTAPPVGGAANKQCIQIMAKALGVPKSALNIASGQSSRLKKIYVDTEALQMGADAIQGIKEKLSQLGAKKV